MRLSRAIPALCFALCLAAAGETPTTVLPLWPHGTPEPAQTAEAEIDVTKPTDALISGHRTRRLTNVTQPTLSFYPAKYGSGATALVFPGGSYVRLAYDGEGVDTCDWLVSIGVSCVLVKYRVPEPRFPASFADLEDAQQAMRLTRLHATEWHIDPQRIGVVGFSGGGHLAVLLCSHWNDSHVKEAPAAQDANESISARPDFAILAYPAYLALAPEEVLLDGLYAPNAATPPTFLIQAEDDAKYHNNALVYYRALMQAHVPAELHYYADGGHGFGIHPANVSESRWTELAAAWLRRLEMAPALAGSHEP